MRDCERKERERDNGERDTLGPRKKRETSVFLLIVRGGGKGEGDRCVCVTEREREEDDSD